MKKDDLEKEVEDAVVDQADDENYGDWRENFQRKTLSKRPSKSLQVLCDLYATKSSILSDSELCVCDAFFVPQEREEEYAKARARIFEQLEAEETKCSPANANASMINGSATANPSANESKVDTPSSSNKMSRLLSAPAFTPSASTSGAAERSRGRHTLSGQQFGDAGGGGSASASGGGGGGGGGGAMSYTRLHASKYGSGGGAAQIPRQHHYNMPYTNTQLPPHIYAQQQQHGYHRPSNPFVDPYGINTIPPYQVNPPSNMHHNNVTGWMEGRDHTAENGEERPIEESVPMHCISRERCTIFVCLFVFFFFFFFLGAFLGPFLSFSQLKQEATGIRRSRMLTEERPLIIKTETKISTQLVTVLSFQTTGAHHRDVHLTTTLTDPHHPLKARQQQQKWNHLVMTMKLLTTRRFSPTRRPWQNKNQHRQMRYFVGHSLFQD